MQSFSLFCLHIDPKNLQKKRSLHFGRFCSPKPELSDGQAGANCETFWRVKAMFTKRRIMPMPFSWMKNHIFQLDPPEKHWTPKRFRG